MLFPEVPDDSRQSAATARLGYEPRGSSGGKAGFAGRKATGFCPENIVHHTMKTNIIMASKASSNNSHITNDPSCHLFAAV